MSECEPLSRPTWVLDVILRKEAPFSFRNSCNCIFVSTIRWIFLTDSFSPLDQLLYEPPGLYGFN